MQEDPLLPDQVTQEEAEVVQVTREEVNSCKSTFIAHNVSTLKLGTSTKSLNTKRT